MSIPSMSNHGADNSNHDATVVNSMTIVQYTVEARKLEHGFRRISARIPFTLP